MEKRFRNRVVELSSAAAVVAVVFLYCVVGGIDLVTGPELSFSLFYLLPVVVVVYRWGTATGQLAAGLAAGVWLWVDHLSGAEHGYWLIPLWNAGVRFGFFGLVAWLVGGLSQAVEREAELARIDSLTGLPNRRAFTEIAQRELERSARSGSGISIAVIDLDDFKRINDVHGHDGGDAVLCRFASEARRVLRSIDFTARTGGDEFAVLLPDVDAAAAVEVLGRLRLALQDAGGIECSIGVASGSGCLLSDLLRSADEALYRAKGAGKGSIVAVDISGSAIPS